MVLRNSKPADLRDASIVLRTQQEPGRSMKTLSVPLTAELRNKIVKEAIDLHWAKLKSNPRDRGNQRVFEFLSAIDPKAFDKYLDSGKVGGQFKGIAQRFVVREISQSDPDLAIEIADSVTSPMNRASLLSVLLDRLPANSPHVDAVEEQFIETIQAIKQPAYRYAIWASLGEYYIHNGKKELADKIVDEHLAEVKKLPNGGWAAFPKSLFAALLVDENPKLALEMIKGATGHERARALGRLAFHCCRTNPSQAMEFLDKIEHSDLTINTAENRIKVAYRMIDSQTDSAFQVAASITEPNQQAWAWGLIALKLVETDSVKAKEALENAIKTLTPERPGSLAASYFSVPLTLAGLIPIAEKVAPEKIESMIWQTVWLTVPRSRWNMGGGSKALKRQNVAVALSRYDQELARALVGDARVVMGSNPSRSAVSQLLFDAQGLPEFMGRIDEKQNFHRLGVRAKLARMLSGSDEAFWNEVSLPEFMHWPIEKFEDD